MLDFFRIMIGILIVFGICSRISSLSIQASVTLNEVAIQPNQVIELYNTASVSADISSWYIDDAGGSTYFTIPNGTTIAPLSCIVFTADFNFNKASPDSVRLFDSASNPTSTSANIIEQYTYTKAPDNAYSFIKKTQGSPEWQTATSSLGLLNDSLLSCIPTPTPSPAPTETLFPSPVEYPSSVYEPTIVPTPTTTPSFKNIFISEVYPHPQPTESEWVELYNGNDFMVTLDNWYIDDIENGGSPPKSFSLKIDPMSYASVTFTASLFNNDGDTVRLLNCDKSEIDSMEYGKMPQENSMGRISFTEDSFCRQIPSKNSVNSPCIFTPTQPIQKQNSAQTIAAVKKIVMPEKNMQLSSVKNAISYNGIRGKPLPERGAVVLGVKTNKAPPVSATPYLSSVSFSYSLLTIVSIFIKMKNA